MQKDTPGRNKALKEKEKNTLGIQMYSKAKSERKVN